MKLRQFQCYRIIDNKTLTHFSLLYLFIGIAICICLMDIQDKRRELLFILIARAVEGLIYKYINSLHASFIL